MRRGFLLALAVMAGSGCDLKLRSRRAAPSPPPRGAQPSLSPEELAIAEWKSALTTARELAATRQYGAALRAFDDLDRRYPALHEDISRERAAVLAKARDEYAEIDKAASQAMARSDEDAAIAALTKVLEFEVDELSSKARSKMQEASAAKSKRLHREARKEVGPILLELQGLLLARKEEEGNAMLNRALAANPALQHEIDWLRGTIIESRSVFAGVGRGMKKLKGEKVEIDGATVTVVDANIETATLERDGGGRFEINLAQLPPALLVRAGREGGIGADFTGQFLLFTGRIAEAREAFRAVENRPDLEALADRVERLLGGGPR